MVQWNNREATMQAVRETAASGCDRVALDINYNHVVYPFEALLLARKPGVHLQFAGVNNPSMKFRKPEEPAPCTVYCPDCAGIPGKAREYEGIGEPRVIGRSLLFLAH